MKKLYYANVIEKLTDYFEEQSREHRAIIVARIPKIDKQNNNEIYYHYVLEAEEGIIDPKYEI